MILNFFVECDSDKFELFGGVWGFHDLSGTDHVMDLLVFSLILFGIDPLF